MREDPLDLRQERERRMLTIRHELEGEITDSGIDLPDSASHEIAALLERFVPGSTARESLALIAAPWTNRPSASVTVNINPQIIRAMESTIIQNVQGVVNLSPQAKEFLVLADRFGGQEAAALQSVVYELEDTDAPPAARSEAKRRLKQFLGQVASTARDVGIDLLKKYLEQKVGL